MSDRVSKVRVRFAPSPTGQLHIGNARTALFNFLFARHHAGTFILRIEDTDLERSTEGSFEEILKDLRWLGLLWDEGPHVDGPLGPYRQSQRVSLYGEFAQHLLKEGRTYPCFCSPERLEALRREQLSRGKMPRYDGRCRSLQPGEAARLESEGRRPALRFRVEGKTISFEDLIHGTMNFNPDDIGDFIVARSDGMAAYNFACVIDDHLMQVTHVIRGEDHLPNTPRQIMLCRALGWEPPVFAHHSLILGPDRTPLSKRHGATAVSQYRDEGFLPEALLNYLVLLGWTSPSGEEILTLAKMAETFSLETLSRSAPIHNRKKLEWLNRFYIRQEGDRELAEKLLFHIRRAGISPEKINREELSRMAGALRDNLVILSDIGQYLGIFYDEKFSFDAGARAIVLDSKNRETLRSILAVLEDPSGPAKTNQEQLLTRLEKGTGRKGKSLYAPLRAAVTGKTRGPELTKTLPLLGREKMVERIKTALCLN